jgi:hypothetical protein
MVVVIVVVVVLAVLIGILLVRDHRSRAAGSVEHLPGEDPAQVRADLRMRGRQPGMTNRTYEWLNRNNGNRK